MSNNGINKFESDFKENFDKTNNYIDFIKPKEEENRDKVKRNNFILSKQFKFNKNFNNININEFMNGPKIKLIKEKEKKKKNLQSLKNIISLMIDSEIIKRKMSKSLKENKIENYYLLNYKWIQEYIKLHQIEKIYKYLKDNKLIESYINKEIEDKILENNFNINEIIFNLDQNLLKNISKPNNYIKDLYINVSYKADYSYKTKSKLKKEYLIYYNDFYLISPETKNSFSKESTSNNIKFDIDYIHLIKVI